MHTELNELLQSASSARAELAAQLTAEGQAFSKR